MTGSLSGGLRGQVSGLPGQKEEALVFWTMDGRGWCIGLRRLALDGSEEYMIISRDEDLKDMGSPLPSPSSAIPKPKTSAAAWAVVLFRKQISVGIVLL